MASQPYSQGGNPVHPVQGEGGPGGFGYALGIAGLLIALAGFAVAAYAIVSLATGTKAGVTVNPFMQPLWPGIPIPALAAGFGMFYLGGVMLSVGAGMSNAGPQEAEVSRRS